MLPLWIDDPAVLLRLDGMPPDRCGRNPVPEDPADDESEYDAGEEDGQACG
jgi:hypothetical protein